MTFHDIQGKNNKRTIALNLAQKIIALNCNDLIFYTCLFKKFLELFIYLNLFNQFGLTEIK